MIISALTDVGLVRENNQDSYFMSSDLDFPLFIIADGMGGHKAGEIASTMAIDIVKDFFVKNKDKLNDEKNLCDIIKHSIKKANQEIYNISLESSLYTGMGTTITLAYILDKKLYIGHVGDSRAYFIEKDNIYQITDDHSLVNELIKNGSITPEEGKTHPQRNMITRAVGTSQEIELDIFINEINNDHILLLCSDGLSNMVEDTHILDIVKKEIDVNNICKKLIIKAKDNGGKDNITVIAIKLER